MREETLFEVQKSVKSIDDEVEKILGTMGIFPPATTIKNHSDEYDSYKDLHVTIKEFLQEIRQKPYPLSNVFFRKSTGALSVLAVKQGVSTATLCTLYRQLKAIKGSGVQTISEMIKRNMMKTIKAELADR